MAAPLTSNSTSTPENQYNNDSKIVMQTDQLISNDFFDVIRSYAIVAAVDFHDGIGRDGTIPWDIPADRQFFKKITMETRNPKLQNCVIMGKTTYFSIPAKFRPLPSRYTIVLSTNYDETVDQIIQDMITHGKNNNNYNIPIVCGSLRQALIALAKPELLLKLKIETVFVVGGANVYNEAMISSELRKQCHTAYITRLLNKSYLCDRFFSFPPSNDNSSIDNNVTKSSSVYISDNKYLPEFVITNTIFGNVIIDTNVTIDGKVTTLDNNNITSYCIQTYKQKNHEEKQYLSLVANILNSGDKKENRTDTETLSLFGAQMRFSLRNNQIPLLTTKRVYWKAVVEELMWFIRGETDSNLLSAKGIHIWDANGTREVLDSCGLCNRECGDLGPIYGFQWRHFGAKYENSNTDYTGCGIDQLKNVVRALKDDPHSRRIIMTAWNPSDFNDMALPPCHILAQFYVSSNCELSCHLYQRSCDMGLGVPFNIASYSLLTMLLAKASGLKLGDFVHTLGDAHIYVNHMDALSLQLQRFPTQFPQLVIKTNNRQFLEDYTFEDFLLLDYNPCDTIKMDMVV